MNALAADPEALVGKVDWITKRWLLRQFCEQENLDWSHPWLKSQDLEYHHIDPARSLGLALASRRPRWDVPAKTIETAVMEPPVEHPRATRGRASCGCCGNTRRRIRLIGKSWASKD